MCVQMLARSWKVVECRHTIEKMATSREYDQSIATLSSFFLMQTHEEGTNPLLPFNPEPLIFQKFVPCHTNYSVLHDIIQQLPITHYTLDMQMHDESPRRIFLRFFFLRALQHEILPEVNATVCTIREALQDFMHPCKMCTHDNVLYRKAGDTAMGIAIGELHFKTRLWDRVNYNPYRNASKEDPLSSRKAQICDIYTNVLRFIRHTNLQNLSDRNVRSNKSTA